MRPCIDHSLVDKHHQHHSRYITPGGCLLLVQAAERQSESDLRSVFWPFFWPLLATIPGTLAKCSLRLGRPTAGRVTIHRCNRLDGPCDQIMSQPYRRHRYFSDPSRCHLPYHHLPPECGAGPSAAIWQHCQKDARFINRFKVGADQVILLPGVDSRSGQECAAVATATSREICVTAMGRRIAGSSGFVKLPSERTGGLTHNCRPLRRWQDSGQRRHPFHL